MRDFRAPNVSKMIRNPGSEAASDVRLFDGCVVSVGGLGAEDRNAHVRTQEDNIL